MKPYLILGVICILISFWVNADAFWFFWWLGVIIILIGWIKEFISG